MKTTLKTNVKGIEISMEFEGSVKELFSLNTSMVTATKEWLDLFEFRGNQIFDLVEAAVERSGNLEKKVYSKEKEVKHFKSIIDKNMK